MQGEYMKNFLVIGITLLLLAGCTPTAGNLTADFTNIPDTTTKAPADTLPATDVATQPCGSNTPEPSGTLSPTGISSPVHTPSPYDAYISTNGGRANVRKNASATAGILAKLEKGTKVTVLQQQGEFFQIRFGENQTGYVSNTLLSKQFVEYTNFWGNTSENLSTGGLIVSQGDWVYISIGGKGIYGYNKNNSAWELFYKSNVYCSSLNIIGDNLYAVAVNKLIKLNIRTKQVREIYSVNTSRHISILAVGDSIYCAGGSKLVRLDTSGKVLNTYLSESMYTVEGLLYDEQYLYYTKYNNNCSLYRMQFDGSGDDQIMPDTYKMKCYINGSTLITMESNRDIFFGELKAKPVLKRFTPENDFIDSYYFYKNEIYYIGKIDSNDIPQKIYKQKLDQEKGQLLYTNTHYQDNDYGCNMDILGITQDRLYFIVYSYGYPEAYKIFSIKLDGSNLKSEMDLVETIARG